MYYSSKSKYSNTKVTVNGETYDSKKEARRHRELLLLERAGKIKKLERQVKYVLIDAQRDENQKVIERECSYYADFQYTDTSTGKTIVEDCKGYRTEVYRIKKKLMLHKYGIRILET